MSFARRRAGYTIAAMVELHEIVGQDAAIARLARTMASGRRPHAYIFAGPSGVGRRTTSEALAKVLLCHQADPGGDATLPSACGACPSCRAFEAGTHPDYHLIYKELARYSADSNVRSRVMQGLGIEVVREFLIGPANRGSAAGRGKVFVVRQAELTSGAAQNALLKTLEEPPPGVTLILICRSPTELLATTRSRCALVSFALLPREFVAERLGADGMAPAEGRFWAACTGGSLGESRRLAAEGLYQTKRELVDRLAPLTVSMDAELADWLIRRTEALADAAVAADRQLARSLAVRQAVGTLLMLLASVYRDVLSRAAGDQRPLIHADQADRIGQLADALDPSAAADVVTQLARYEQLLWRNANMKIVWENVVITCATGEPLNV